LNDLTSILIHFRANRYAVTTDIEKAFLNIGLDADDRDVTRFFWLSDPDDPSSALQTYRFKSVLFGATCSPYILNATILKHLSTVKCDFTKQISKDLYVDNIISSVPDKETLMNFYKCSREFFQKAGFNLRSWASNYENLRDIARTEDFIDEDTTTKVLRMRWDSENDILTFPHRCNMISISHPLTKRELLKQSASIYDPLGILNPLTVRSKLLLQSLWQRKLDLDEILPEDVTAEWTRIKSDIEQGILTMETTRYYFSDSNNTHARNIHIFTDSSMKAYGVHIHRFREGEFIRYGKNRVAPIKKMTIPKLELMAALIGAKLADHITKSLECEHVTLWSDSQVVLSWLVSSKQPDVFVKNRIKQIHELTGTFKWRYCPTDSNPTD
jgi:ribonuclease HI